MKPTFNDLINGKQLVLVDFYATWCGPCKSMVPVLQEVAGKVSDKAKIIKIDIDKNLPLATKLKIMGVPTFILYKEGKILWQESGMQSSHKLEELIIKYA